MQASARMSLGAHIGENYMAITVRELKQWIEDAGLTDNSILEMDGDGETLLSDVPGKMATAYLWIGGVEVEEDD